MENEAMRQPLDILMTELGLSNADLVKASTEQLSFKMVQKGRKGRRLTPNIQEKILSALLKVKPDLKTRRRDLFRYELDQEAVDQINDAIELIKHKKIKYPQYVDLLVQAGVNRYAVEVAANQVTYYGAGGEAHVEQGPAVREEEPGAYNEASLRAAISDAQQEKIDHPSFLRRIFEAGITSYEVNLRSRRIDYKGQGQSFKEDIPEYSAEEKIVIPKAAPAAKKPSGKAKAKKKTIPVKNSIKARKAKKAVKRLRVKKRAKK